MAKTKVKGFSACQIQEINSFLSNLGIKYVDLKIIPTVDTSLLLIYEEGDSDLSSDKGLLNAWNYLTDVTPSFLFRFNTFFDIISKLPEPTRV